MRPSPTQEFSQSKTVMFRNEDEPKSEIDIKKEDGPKHDDNSNIKITSKIKTNPKMKKT